MLKNVSCISLSDFRKLKNIVRNANFMVGICAQFILLNQ